MTFLLEITPSHLRAIELVEFLRPDEAMELFIEIAFLVYSRIVL
ncbi:MULTISPECIES: hypothetical protein [unclassified Microcoleus]